MNNIMLRRMHHQPQPFHVINRRLVCMWLELGDMASFRLCRATIDAKRTTHMFRLEKQWASRISTLLHVTVDGDDQLPPHVCNMCT